MAAIKDSEGEPGSRRVSATLIATALVGALVAGLGMPTIPTVAAEFETTLVRAQWTVSVPLLVGVVSIPLLSRLAELRGRRSVLIVTLVLIAAGGAVSASAQTLAQVLGGRALQGFGYAIIPIAAGLARQHLAARRRDFAVAMISTSLLIGVGLSNPAVGLMIDVASLDHAFVASIAAALLVAAAVAVWVPAHSPAGPREQLDWAGAVLVMAALALIMIAIEESAAPDTPWARTVTLAVTGVALFATWVVHELRTGDPLVDLRLTTGQGVWIVSVTGALTGLAMFAGMTALNVLLQRPESQAEGLGLSVFQCGLVLLPLSVAGFLASSASRPLQALLSPAWILATGFAIIFTGYLLLSIFHTHLWQFSAITALLGTGVGVIYSVHYRIIVERVVLARVVSATGANHLLRLLGGALGSTIAAVALTAERSESSSFTRVTAVGCGATLLALAAVLGWARAESHRRGSS